MTYNFRKQTQAITAGRNPKKYQGAVNTPVFRASTILSDSFEDLCTSRKIPPGEGVTYGVDGTPTTYALEEAIATLEGGFRSRLCSSGLNAIAAVFISLLRSGDHVLIPDNVYGPTRRLCSGLLAGMNIDVTYYNPLLGQDIRDFFCPRTAIVFLESPGSLTFEMQDIPQIAEQARRIGAAVVMDNTWATPLYFKPFLHGVNISIHAVTKYISGHSDLVMGAVTSDKNYYPKIQEGWRQYGFCASSDDSFLALRGIRSLHARLPVHWGNGLRLAEWLKKQKEVVRVIHPALPEDAGYPLWRRDFLGASGLFSFILAPEFSSYSRLATFLDSLQLFGMGASWGGFESLILPVDPCNIRTATAWPSRKEGEGQLLRVHAGLEDPDDLISDLSDAFDRIRRVD